MKAKYFIGIIGLIAVWAILLTSSFAQLITQSDNCVVSQKGDKNSLIVSCPDGNRTIDAGGRADLYRVGDRINIYGLSGSQPAPLPGGAQSPGRSVNQQTQLPSETQSPGRR